MKEKINFDSKNSDKSIIKVDGHLNRNEVELVRNKYLEDKNKLFQDTKGGILKNLINNDYRKLSEDLIGKVGIKLVQEYLFKDEIIKTGNKEKYADGIFGPGTFRKLIDFQKNNGLKVDGIAGTSVLYQISRLLPEYSKKPEIKETNVPEETNILNETRADINELKVKKTEVDNAKEVIAKVDNIKKVSLKKVNKLLSLDKQEKFDESKYTKLELGHIKAFSDAYNRSDSYIKKLDLNDPKDFKKLLNQVDRFVNFNIKYVSDKDNYNVNEYWATIKETIASRSGDCEDMALLKAKMLVKYGVDEKDLKFVYGKTREGVEHLVLSYEFKNGEEPLILDNTYNGPNSSELTNKISFNRFDIGKKLKPSNFKTKLLLNKLVLNIDNNNKDGDFLDTLMDKVS